MEIRTPDLLISKQALYQSALLAWYSRVLFFGWYAPAALLLPVFGRPTPQPFWLSPLGRQPSHPHGWHNGWPKDRHGCAIWTWGGQTVCPPMDVSYMDITTAGHLLVYYMDTASTGPNITDQTYVDQPFMDTTIMHRFFFYATVYYYFALICLPLSK